MLIPSLIPSDALGVGHIFTAIAKFFCLLTPFFICLSLCSFQCSTVSSSFIFDASIALGVGHIADAPPPTPEMRRSHIGCGYNLPLTMIPSSGQLPVNSSSPSSPVSRKQTWDVFQNENWSSSAIGVDLIHNSDNLKE